MHKITHQSHVKQIYNIHIIKSNEIQPYIQRVRQLFVVKAKQLACSFSLLIPSADKVTECSLLLDLGGSRVQFLSLITNKVLTFKKQIEKHF